MSIRISILTQHAHAGDAIGHQVAAKVCHFLECGDEVLVFLESEERLHPQIPGLHVAAHTAETLWESEGARSFLITSDLVVVEFGGYFSLLDLLPALERLPERPRILFDYHGVTPPELWHPSRRREQETSQRQRALAWCADLVLTHSQFMADELAEATALPDERLRTIPCFVPSKDTTAKLPDVRFARQLESARILLFVGRVAPNKRLDLLVDAVSQLVNKFPNVHAVVVGDDEDIYIQEKHRVCEQARKLGVLRRLRFTGKISESELHAWYRDAAVLVIPSDHEGFCMPVIEAMAAELPVIVARSSALPETLGDAGLSFRAGDAAALTATVEKVLAEPVHPAVVPSQFRVAVVSPRFGHDFAGGAERSLRTLAFALHEVGHQVEVFTTCNRDASVWRNDLPVGTTYDGPLPVHRFPIDSHDRELHLASLTPLGRNRPLTTEQQADYVRHSLHASTLVDALSRRVAEFDAVVVGPYLFGLTHDVARTLHENVLLVPCFHDEPIAENEYLLAPYRGVGGILYHSQAEREFAERRLAMNHPNSHVVGTWIDVSHRPSSSPSRSRERLELVYCGRYSKEKGFDEVLEYCERYERAHPGTLRLTLMGQGTPPADRPWIRELGFVDEKRKAEVLASSSALVLLSRNESLSIVTLEALSAGLPVIGHRKCSAVRELLDQSGGGQAVAGFAAFADCLNDLRRNPSTWSKRGESGRAFVSREYADKQRYTQRITQALRQRCVPLREQMRTRGLERARTFHPEIWRQRFNKAITECLAIPQTDTKPHLIVTSQSEIYRASSDAGRVLISLRVENHGDRLLAARGPARSNFLIRIVGSSEVEQLQIDAPLMPGEWKVFLIPVQVPRKPGEHDVEIQLQDTLTTVRLIVEDEHEQRETESEGIETSQFSALRKFLAEAQRLATLPNDYVDVTQGMFASVKRLIKQKLFNNFRKGYIDPLSQQQSDFNHLLLTLVGQLTEQCAALTRICQQHEAELEKLREAKSESVANDTP